MAECEQEWCNAQVRQAEGICYQMQQTRETIRVAARVKLLAPKPNQALG